MNRFARDVLTVHVDEPVFLDAMSYSVVRLEFVRNTPGFVVETRIVANSASEGSLLITDLAMTHDVGTGQTTVSSAKATP